MTKRYAGVDLFRVLGLFFVNALHANLYNGFYFFPQEGATVVALNSLRWLFFGCNGMFMLMTGYLKTTKPFDKKYYRGLLPILVGYLLTCVVSYPIRYFLIGETDPLNVWIERLFTFSNYAWYVEMYIGLILISPFINMALDKLEKPKNQLWFATVMVILTALPSITAKNFFINYWTAMYPITYYVIGAVIRRIQPKVNSLLCFIEALAVALGLGIATMVTATEGFNSGFGQGYGGFWITVMVTFLFLSMYRLKLGETASWILSKISGGVFEGYILSRLFDVWIYSSIKECHNPIGNLKLYLFVTIPVFIVSLTAGNLLHFVSVKLTSPRKKETA